MKEKVANSLWCILSRTYVIIQRSGMSAKLQCHNHWLVKNFFHLFMKHDEFDFIKCSWYLWLFVIVFLLLNVYGKFTTSSDYISQSILHKDNISCNKMLNYEFIVSLCQYQLWICFYLGKHIKLKKIMILIRIHVLFA